MGLEDEFEIIQGFGNRMRAVFRNHKTEMLTSFGLGVLAAFVVTSVI